MNNKNRQDDNMKDLETLESQIWSEEPESDNPFVAEKCYCSGYDVYGEILGNARWVEYLYLIIKHEKPEKTKADILENLAIALANPGPREYSVRAAMAASVGGSTASSSLMAAIAVGAGQYGGAHEIALIVDGYQQANKTLAHFYDWVERIQQPQEASISSIWPDVEHPPGFDPYGASCAKPVLQSLQCLSDIAGESSTLIWLKENRKAIESELKCPLSMSGVAAAAFVDLEFDAQQAEMIYMFLRLPGAIGHALEQHLQFQKYPLYQDKVILTDDPANPLDTDQE